MNNYDDGFKRAQQQYENQTDDHLYEDLEREQRRREAEEDDWEITRLPNFYD